VQISARVLKEFGREPRVIVGQEPIHEPTRVIVNVKRDAESDAAVELFGERPKPSICWQTRMELLALCDVLGNHRLARVGRSRCPNL